jgi:putative chitinase
MSIVITEAQLKQIMPTSSNTAVWIKALNEAMERFEINTPYRGAAFLAQIAHESGELGRLVENLNYSAKRLMQVWPSRFSTLAKAQHYEHNPEKLANYVYADRLGNGDEASGDGWKFRGRGLIQVTGRGNYQTAAKALGLALGQQPELLEQPGPAALSAAQFWQSHGLNEFADDRNNENDAADFVTISIRINGGRAGLNERKRYWQKAKSVLGIA